MFTYAYEISRYNNVQNIYNVQNMSEYDILHEYRYTYHLFYMF